MADHSNVGLAANLEQLILAGEQGRDCAAAADAVLAEVADRIRSFALSVDLMLEGQEERISHLRAELRSVTDGAAELRTFCASIEVVRAEAFRRSGGGS